MSTVPTNLTTKKASTYDRPFLAYPPFSFPRDRRKTVRGNVRSNCDALPVNRTLVSDDLGQTSRVGLRGNSCLNGIQTRRDA